MPNGPREARSKKARYKRVPNGHVGNVPHNAPDDARGLMFQTADTTKQSLAEQHTPAAIRKRLESGPAHSYVGDFVLGAVDGSVTTFAVVAGVAGAGLAQGPTIIIIL